MARVAPPLIAHIIYRLDVGGLENGLVRLINQAPADRYRHAIICLTESTNFSQRIRQPDVPIIQLQKRSGREIGVYRRLWRALKDLDPTIVHTRNLGVLEAQIAAALAGVPVRIHGEHGRDMYDLDGSSVKYRLFRKSVRPLVHHYTAVSRDLATWLVSAIGIPANRVTQIYNGVDTERFHPACAGERRIGPQGFAPEGAFVVGTVGRMHTVKDQLTLVRAFLRLIETFPEARARVRLMLVGDGPLRRECSRLLESANAGNLAWLPGERSDIPELMRSMDLFVLPSLGEGISNTILEAMASGLPVVATRVGGNPELVTEGRTGTLVPASDPDALMQAIYRYLCGPDLAPAYGRAARAHVEASFSWDSMVTGYMGVYDKLLRERLGPIFGHDQ